MWFNKIDIFGSNISIKFQGLDVHQTKFGAFFTVLVFTLVFLRLIILINDVIIGQNPTVLYQERFVQDPKMFEITPNSLSLALGLLDMNFNYYIDETIFSIQGVHITKQNVWNNQTKQYEQILSSKLFNLVNCTEKHIPDPQLRTFFLQSNLYMHQCIPLDLTLQIQGQFNSEVYQELNFYFKKCVGQKCKSDSDINKILNSNNVELVFTDVFFSPQNKDNPFTKFSRDLYWVTSKNLPREVNVFLRNNYVETDVGWITSNLNTNIYPSYSYDDIQITDPSNDFFFHLVIRFEKSKENLYQRNYDNLFIILSQIGGISSLLLTIFGFICKKYSQIHLNKSLINQLFTFQNDTSQLDSYNFIQNSTNNQNLFSNQVEIAENRQSLNNSNFNFKQSQIQQNLSYQSPPNKAIIKNKLGELNQANRSKQIEDHQQKIDISLGSNSNQQQSNLFAKDQILEYFENQEQIENKFHKLKFNTFAYMISSILKCFKCYKTQKQLIDFGFQELNNTLDIKNILQKLTETDKLKRVVLNNEQLVLFDYIPKPNIKYKLQENQKLNIQKICTFSQLGDIKQIEKLKKAKNCFQSIKQKGKQNKIDVSLLSLIQKFQFDDSPSKQITKQLNYPALLTQQNFQNENINIQQNKLLQEGNKLQMDGSDDSFVKNDLKNYAFTKYVRHNIKNEDQSNK